MWRGDVSAGQNEQDCQGLIHLLSSHSPAMCACERGSGDV